MHIYEPMAEVCDGLDNDCSGEEDDGYPSQMGETPPEYAATLVDSSVPPALRPGDVANVWAIFRNEGSLTWQPNDLWLRAECADRKTCSTLYDMESWLDYSVAAALAEEVEPGELARFSWTVRAPDEIINFSKRVFRLEDPKGRLLRCPSPMLEVSVQMSQLGDEDTDSQVPGERPEDDVEPGCGCRMGASDRRSGGWLGAWLIAVVLGLARRRRH